MFLRPVLDFGPLVLLTVLAVSFRSSVPGWLLMWLVACAIYFGCKWLTWRRDSRVTSQPALWLVVGYLLFWPGMDPKPFLNKNGRCKEYSDGDWLNLCAAFAWAALKSVSGLVLLLLVAHETFHFSALLRAWLGMVGIILLLHFGTFELLALAWQSIGIPAEPLMRRPLAARSLAEFWGKRWNTAFHALAFRFAFRPVAKIGGPRLATLCVFLLSGLVHDLVISLPAHGGYGLPTIYFLIQGAGVLLERSAVGRRIGLARGLPGRLFVLAFTLGPVALLFHSRFIHTVILPMLDALKVI